MDPVLQLLSAAGVAGVVVFLFVNGTLTTSKACDQRVSEISKQWEARFSDLRADRNEWKRLALGSERQLEKALPVVATAIGAPVPSATVAPPEKNV